MKRFSDWDRQFVSILSAVPSHGLDAVTEACRQALASKAVSQEVVINLLHRAQDQEEDPAMDVESRLALKQPPMADRARYDLLRREVHRDS